MGRDGGDGASVCVVYENYISLYNGRSCVQKPGWLEGGVVFIDADRIAG